MNRHRKSPAHHVRQCLEQLRLRLEDAAGEGVFLPAPPPEQLSSVLANVPREMEPARGSAVLAGPEEQVGWNWYVGGAAIPRGPPRPCAGALSTLPWQPGVNTCPRPALSRSGVSSRQEKVISTPGMCHLSWIGRPLLLFHQCNCHVTMVTGAVTLHTLMC